MVWYPEYKIAVGWDNVAGLTTLEGLTVTDDIQPFIYPKGVKQFDAGIRKTRADGTDYFVGWGSTRWVFGVLTWRQWAYIKQTFCAGGYSGNVTVRTRTSGLTYANFNAVLKLPKEIELSDTSAPVIADVVWTFAHLREIPPAPIA
jgi:hypothetical protein